MRDRQEQRLKVVKASPSTAMATSSPNLSRAQAISRGDDRGDQNAPLIATFYTLRSRSSVYATSKLSLLDQTYHATWATSGTCPGNERIPFSDKLLKEFYLHRHYYKTSCNSIVSESGTRADAQNGQFN